MFLEKDLPIIGKSGIDRWADRCLRMAGENMLEVFSKKLDFPGTSPILDSKGRPFTHGDKPKTIKFKRYNRLKEGTDEG